jgi:plasmid stability protein
MPVTLTIKQVPDELAARLRAIAASNHRSLQGELLHTIETRVAAIDTRYSDAPLVTRLEVNDSGARQTSYSPAVEEFLRSSPTDGLMERLEAILGNQGIDTTALPSREELHERESWRRNGIV